MKRTINTSVLVLIVASVLMTAAICAAEDDCERCHQDIVANFTTSLHYTGAGMHNEYDRGAAGHFDIDMDEYYDQWKCAKCHVVTCTQCHIGENVFESHQYEVTIATCDPCHKKKQTATYVGDMPGHKSTGPHADIHYEMGLICTDCHTSDELHGTGVMHSTQLEAVSIECIDCHENPGKVVNGMEVTQYSSESYSHKLHGDKLSCISCHTGWSLTCNGCHLDTRKGTKPVPDEFYLGVDTEGQITTFLKMDATSGNETHTGYGEWFSHTITRDAKDCAFCHENEEVLLAGCEGQIIGEGGSLIDDETVERVIRIGGSEKDEEEPVPDNAGGDGNSMPGFDGIFVLAGLIAVAYLVSNQRE